MCSRHPESVEGGGQDIDSGRESVQMSKVIHYLPLTAANLPVLHRYEDPLRLSLINVVSETKTYFLCVPDSFICLFSVCERLAWKIFSYVCGQIHGSVSDL